MGVRLFDLNIEEVLEAWEVSHAIREVISNALDEQALSGTKDIEIAKLDGDWVVRDFGRGLKIDHFTLNENKEKIAAPTGVMLRRGTPSNPRPAPILFDPMHIQKVLSQIGDRLAKAQEELRIAEEQLLFQMDVVEETKTRMLVSETPIADREYRGEIQNRLQRVGRFHPSRLIFINVEPGRKRLAASVRVGTVDLESDPVPVCVTPRDTFPPAAPKGRCRSR